MAWLLMILLAHGHQAPWVEFEICQLDVTQRPPVAQRARDHATIFLRADAVQGIAPIRPKPEGLNCTRIGAATGQTVYVVGTYEDVLRKLKY